MKVNAFKVYDYVSFPADKGSDEVREGFVLRLRQNQIDIVSARSKEGSSFSDFGFHKKYMEKDRFEEIEVIEIKKDISSWELYRVIAWAMVRFFQTYGEFMTDQIKHVTEDGTYTEPEKIDRLIKIVRDLTIPQDRKTKRQVHK
jgi:hypothetical protein